MQTQDFFFDLPEHLIAHEASERGKSRLMILDPRRKTWEHRYITDLIEYLPRESLLVLNNTRVRKARLMGRDTKARMTEFLFLETCHDDASLWWVLSSRQHKLDERYVLQADESLAWELIEKEGPQTRVRFLNRAINEEDFQRYGELPLPPYMKRKARLDDEERYQTIYAQTLGSVAAPTAGLHLTRELLDAFESKGIQREELTLHVGLGTFKPIRTKTLEEHSMHREFFHLSPDLGQRLEKAKEERRPIVAVGSTTVRALETAFQRERQKFLTGWQSSCLFIKPSYHFSVVDRWLTNFHTPYSSLLVMAAAFAGREFVLDAYQEAVKKEYRFFSYGDACLFLNTVE